MGTVLSPAHSTGKKQRSSSWMVYLHSQFDCVWNENISRQVWLRREDISWLLLASFLEFGSCFKSKEKKEKGIRLSHCFSCLPYQDVSKQSHTPDPTVMSHEWIPTRMDLSSHTISRNKPFLPWCFLSKLWPQQGEKWSSWEALVLVKTPSGNAVYHSHEE